ncbi:MAG TPA: hypothetical protein VHY84_22995 [Bryobacteraceae bacterium]|jgi:hypothetical protein|nr:hypothetical protein [Bryobacteraceae bacterium]
MKNHILKALVLKLYWIPSWELGVVIFGIFGAFSLIGLYVGRSRMSRYAHKSNDLVFNFVAIAGVVYALAVGLIAVATWDKFKSVQDVANDEAYALNNLFLDSNGLPAADAADVKERVRQYLHFAIEKEWPAQMHGERIEGGDALALGIMTKLTNVQTSSSRQDVLLGQALTELNRFLSQRRARENALDEALPGVLYFLVLGGAAVLIGMTYLLWTEEFWLQFALTLSLSAMISLMVFLIVAMDHPLWGPVSASPEAFRNVLDTIGHM